MAFARIALKNYMGARLLELAKFSQLLAFSLKCAYARLFEISLILLCSYFLYINDKSVMIWLKQKGWNILTFGFSLSATAQPITVLEALRVSGKRSKLHDKHFVYWFILCHICFFFSCFLFSFLIFFFFFIFFKKVKERLESPSELPVHSKKCNLRRLEGVSRCYIVCETKEDYKEGCLMVWANYMSPCCSIVGLYLKGTCDVISVTMATHKVHKSVL